MNQLLENYERFVYDERPKLGECMAGSLGVVYGHLRRMNERLVTEHRDLFDSRFVMTDREVTIQGHPVRAELVRLKTVLDLDAYEGAENRGVDEFFINTLADLVAGELRSHSTEGEFAYFIPVSSAGIILTPSFDLVATLVTWRGVVPLNEPCPPCDIAAKDADLTQFGLPPLK